MSVGLNIEWGGSGAQDVGAERFTVYTPTLYFGKGFGDLPASMGWARPFAITGQVGYAIPGSSYDRNRRSRHRRHRHRVQSARPGLGRLAAIQPALPQIRGGRSRPAGFLQPPDSAGRGVAADAGLQYALSSGTVTTGTINPGVIWVGKYYQVGVEAMIPVNRQSGTGVGAIAQLHLFLDDIFPNSIGRPIFSNTIASGRPTFGNKP